MKIFSKIIPKSLQAELFRRVVNTKQLSRYKNITIKLADTFDEYKKAFELLHDCYVRKNLMEPHPSGMRCNIHSFLPHNSVIIAINENGQVIGTVSIIKDNLFGLPAEAVYQKEVNNIRNEKHHQRELVEVSALSIAPEYREQAHAIQFLLNKYLYLHCRDVLKINTLVIVVHPNAELFYHSLLLFRPLGEIVNYGFVKGALARLLYLDFSGGFEEFICEVYHHRKDSLADYILFQEDSRLLFSTLRADEIETRNRGVTLQLIKSAQYELTRLGANEISQIISGLNLRLEDLQFLGIEKSEVLSDYRFQKKIEARVLIDNSSHECKIYNLSPNGAFLQIPPNLLKKSDLGELIFNWQGKEFTTRFKTCWINEGITNKLPHGAGIEFQNNILHFFEDSIQYRKAKKIA